MSEPWSSTLVRARPSGLKPGWVAGQLGHSVEMFYRVYSRWIDEQDGGAERRKLDAFLDSATDPTTARGAVSAPSTA